VASERATPHKLTLVVGVRLGPAGEQKHARIDIVVVIKLASVLFDAAW